MLPHPCSNGWCFSGKTGRPERVKKKSDEQIESTTKLDNLPSRELHLTTTFNFFLSHSFPDSLVFLKVDRRIQPDEGKVVLARVGVVFRVDNHAAGRAPVQVHSRRNHQCRDFLSPFGPGLKMVPIPEGSSVVFAQNKLLQLQSAGSEKTISESQIM